MKLYSYEEYFIKINDYFNICRVVFVHVILKLNEYGRLTKEYLSFKRIGVSIKIIKVKVKKIKHLIIEMKKKNILIKNKKNKKKNNLLNDLNF